jgi:hypothetical protein
MQILKRYSHKKGLERIHTHYPHLLQEITAIIEGLDPVSCLTKVSSEKSKQKRWGGLLFSPPAINAYLKNALYPLGWATWDDKQQKYIQPGLYFSDDTTISGADRYRKMDGLKERVGLEIQLGKYAFMGYDIFSKLVIFRNKGTIDYGIEIVLVQAMVNAMSTGVSAFEHIMIDFEHRGEADLDVPVCVLGIGPTPDEWAEVSKVQALFRADPAAARQMYPNIGLKDLKGTKPGPK